LWGNFGYALRKENRILFEEMLNRCKKKDYVDCPTAKGENFSAEALFLVLLFEQHKMIQTNGIGKSAMGKLWTIVTIFANRWLY